LVIQENKANKTKKWGRFSVDERSDYHAALISMERIMNVDRNIKFLMIVLICGLFLNGLSPWINPSDVNAKESTSVELNKNSSDCYFARKNSIKNSDGINTIERLSGYIESKVNDIDRAISEIDRKLEDLSSSYKKNEK